MKKRIVINIGALVFFSLFSLVNAAGLRCESQSEDLVNAHSKLAGEDPRRAPYQDQYSQEEKSERFQELEWIIKQKLLKEYEHMDQEEDVDFD